VNSNRGLLRWGFVYHANHEYKWWYINNPKKYNGIWALSLYHTNIINQCLKILNFLIQTVKDGMVLLDDKIIINWMGDVNVVIRMISDPNSDILMSYFNLQYFCLCNNLNNFFENPCKHIMLSF